MTTSEQSSFETIINHIYNNQEKRAEAPKKAKRPLKMPKNYDFSVRNVDWNEYKNDYILRTDAVWEKSKLLDIFHTHYKTKFNYDSMNNIYMYSNIRMMPVATTEPEHLEDVKPFVGYTDIDGCIWQFKMGPKLQNPASLSKFLADKEGDSWYLCHLTFQKFMLCQERSPVKIDEAHLYNRGFFDYPCFD